MATAHETPAPEPTPAVSQPLAKPFPPAVGWAILIALAIAFCQGVFSGRDPQPTFRPGYGYAGSGSPYYASPPYNAPQPGMPDSDTWTGPTRELDFHVKQSRSCSFCGGDGTSPGMCYRCTGSGRVEDGTCHNCGGDGEVERPCLYCTNGRVYE